MEGSAVSFEQVYLYTFIICGALTLLYVFLSDILEGIFEAMPDGPFSPTLILSFLTFLSCTGYILERFLSVHSGIAFLFATLVALIIASLLHFFVLVPLASAESSLAYSDEDLKGRLGMVIISIPEDGYGEVLLQGIGGNIAKAARSFDEKAIQSGTEVLVIDINQGVLYVTPHQSLEDY